MTKNEIQSKLVPTLDLLSKNDITFKQALDRLVESFNNEFNKPVEVMVEVDGGCVTDVTLLQPEGVKFSYVLKDFDNLRECGEMDAFHHSYKDHPHAETIFSNIDFE